MKRKISASSPTKITPASAPKAQERELAEAMSKMVETMATRFRNQVFAELHVDTVEKFADAQVGNYAVVFLKLAEATRRKLYRQFNDDRIEELVAKIMDKVNTRNRKELYSKVEQRIGISAKELAQTEGLMADMNALHLETSQWVKKLRDETLEFYTSNTLRAMTQGESLATIMKQFDGMVEKRKNHAKFTARNQIGNYNSIATKMRAQNLGVTHAIWRTSEDERVRECHRVRDGETFELAKGLFSKCDGKWLLPGTDYQCFPGSAQLDHASLCQKLYRRWYTGELTELVFDDGTVLASTPNHPILTVSGFKAARLIDESDHVIRAFDKSVDGVEFNGHHMKPTFEQIFSALEFLGVEHDIAPAISGKFHGDVSDGEINVIAIDRLLVDIINPAIRKKFNELALPMPDQIFILDALTSCGQGYFGGIASGNATASIMRSFDLLRSRFLVHLSPLELFGFALGAWCNTGAEKSLANSASADSEFFSDSIFAFSVLVHGRDVIDRKIDAITNSSALCLNPHRRELGGKECAMNADLGSGDLNHLAVSYKVGRIVDKRSVNFSGHVYNLQTVSGDYITSATAVSNCRCSYELIVPEE